MDKHSLDYFFSPHSIAVVGASNNPDTPSFNLLYNLVNLGFRGKIYAVNPNVAEIMGVRTYSSLAKIEGNVDLVISAVSAQRTLDLIDQYVHKNVRAVVIVSGGFSEIGAHGLQMQDEMARQFKDHSIRVIGPNTLSPLCFDTNLVISFCKIRRMRQGSVSMIFQSGMYDPRLNWLYDDFHLGINKLLDLGNKMDIDETDALEYLAADSSTKIIGIHTEGIKCEGRRFFEVLRATTKKKPVILLKGGRSVAGARAAASHTGSIIQEDDFVFDGMLKQAGVIRAKYLEDLFDFAKAFEYIGILPAGLGKRCAVASFSGGEGVLTTDICNDEGFALAVPQKQTVDKLSVLFPPWGITANPIDLGICYQFFGHRDFFKTYLRNMARDPNTDCMLIQFPDVEMLFNQKDVHKPFLAFKERGKPLVTWAATQDHDMDQPVALLESYRIPVYSSARSAVKSLSAIYRYTEMNSIA